jgi:hypothetical protein
MVKLAEINIDPVQRTLDYLISNLAVFVEQEYDRFYQESKGFSLTVEDILSTDEIADEINDLNNTFAAVKVRFSPHHQTYRLVVYMLNYLKNS